MAAMGIYAITHLESGRRYIGSAVNIKRRWNVHRSRLAAGTHHSRFLQRAWVKYGPEAFRFSVLDYVEDRDELLRTEQQWLDSLQPVFNTSLTAGNTLGTTLTVEHRMKISRSLMGNSHGKGHVHTPEHRAKNAAAQRGRTWSAQTRAKMEGRFKGRVISAEARATIAQTLRERGSTVVHIAQSAGIDGAVFSREDAARELGCSMGFVRRCIDDGLLPASIVARCYIVKGLDLEAARPALLARLRGKRNLPYGERAYNAKLTAAQVLTIRARHAAGTATMTAMARECGVSLTTVQNIVKRKKWAHI